VVDTGPLYAAYDISDNDHARCRAILESTGEELVLPAPVVVEFDWRCGSNGVPEKASVLLDDILAGAFTVIPLNSNDYLRCKELIARYTDAKIGLVDASVLAIVERLAEPKLATLDSRHFRMLRPKHTAYLELLPG
jgi:predicted nucleic acid-binding protein